MAPPVGEVLAELDPAAYVIDCTWNLGAGQETYVDRTSRLVRTLRKAHPRTPILFLGQSLMRPEAHPTDLTRRQEVAVQSVEKEGFEGIQTIPAADFIGNDGEGTVDGVHYNDIGMERQARSLLPVLRKVLGEAAKP
jgi:lysophospholipase L1-like esterase